jgi:hypothetical protein
VLFGTKCEEFSERNLRTQTELPLRTFQSAKLSHKVYGVCVCKIISIIMCLCVCLSVFVCERAQRSTHLTPL